MDKIALVGKFSIDGERIVEAIQDNIQNTKVLSYDINTIQQLIEDSENLPKLLIVNVDIAIERLSYIDYFISKNVKVVIWFHEYTSYMNEFLKRDIYGYFFNGMISSEIIMGIKYILKGSFYIHPDLILESKKMVEFNRPRETLSKREWEVLQDIVAGLTNAKIAKKRGLSAKTVDNQVISLMRKINVNNRTAAAIYALKMGWIKL